MTLKKIIFKHFKKINLSNKFIYVRTTKKIILKYLKKDQLTEILFTYMSLKFSYCNILFFIFKYY